MPKPVKISMDDNNSNNFAKYYSTVRKHVLKEHQRIWLDSVLAGNTFILGSRQIGKSFLVAFAAVVMAAGYKTDSIDLPPSDVLVISADREKAMNIIKAVNKHLEVLGWAVTDIKHDVLGGVQTAVLKNGRSIKALSGVSRALQGFTGHVIIDELSLTDGSPEEIMAQALSVTSSKPYYRITVCTNADEYGSFVDSFVNDFGPYWTGRRCGWSVFNTTIWDVYPELTPKLLAARNSMSTESWQRFYENRFVTGRSKLFTDASMRFLDVAATGNIWISVDPGFSATGNPTGIVVCKVDGHRVHVLQALSWWAVQESEQVARLQAMYESLDATRIFIDIGSAGLAMAQKLERNCNVTRISVSRKMQQQGFLKLRNGLTDGVITISSGCHDLVTDLASIEIDAGGNYTAPQVPDRSGGKRHADCAFALMQLVHNVNGKNSMDMQEVRITESLNHAFGGGLVWDGTM